MGTGIVSDNYVESCQIGQRIYWNNIRTQYPKNHKRQLCQLWTSKAKQL